MVALPTLLDIVKANGSDALTGLIDVTTKVHPEITQVPARTIKGINYKTLVRTALGSTAAGFRDANSGVAPIKNTYENRLVEAYYVEATWNADKAVADVYEDGAAAWMALEADGIMQGQMQGLAAQFFYGTGTGGNAGGFPGLMQAYDSTAMVVDAGGTTDDVATSIWLVRVGPKDVQWVWGNAGQLQMTPATAAAAIANPVKIIDPNDSTKQFLGYQQTLTGRVGLQVGSTRSICRIKKITTDSGKGATDDLLAEALAKFPAGLGPNFCFLTQRSLAQIQKSRTSTKGTVIRAGLSDFPRSIVGIDGQEIPLLVTDALLNTEKLAS